MLLRRDHPELLQSRLHDTLVPRAAYDPFVVVIRRFGGETRSNANFLYTNQ